MLRYQGYIYIIKTGAYYKIGWSARLQSRLAVYPIYNPYPVEVIAKAEFADCRVVERQLHRSFKQSRISGEWFELDTAQLALLRAYFSRLRASSEVPPRVVFTDQDHRLAARLLMDQELQANAL
jgi:hypothetical protein